jgi:hypothetical protein
MILGINPIHIVSIGWDPFRRFGRHPMENNLIRKKYKQMSCFVFPFYKSKWDIMFPGIMFPTVYIYGTDNRILADAKCKTNDEARLYCKKLNDQMDDLFGHLEILEKLKKTV